MIYARQTVRHVGKGRRRFGAATLTAIVIATAVYGVVSATPSTFLELDGNVKADGTGTFDWANNGTLTTTGGTFSISGTGGVFNGGHFNGNTTPPTSPTRTAAATS